MDPMLVRFSQSSIRYRFPDGSSIDDLAEKLQTQSIVPSQVPPLRLVLRNGVYFTLDNRRLEAFRRAGVPIPWRAATPTEVETESWKFTTINDGVLVRIRGRST